MHRSGIALAAYHVILELQKLFRLGQASFLTPKVPHVGMNMNLGGEFWMAAISIPKGSATQGTG